MAPENPPPLTPSSPNALASVEYDIFRACNEARRDRASVTLIAVSKTFDAGAIAPVIEAGQRGFGASRVTEAKANGVLLRARPASDRAAAIQQGQRGRGAVRRHPFGRPSQHLRSVSQGN